MDARYEKVRVDRRVVSQGVLVVSGVKDDGFREILAVEVADRWRPSHLKVAEHLEEHVEECLSCLAVPESHRRWIRTTNGLERLNQEIKRRTTRVVRIFPNREACLRLVRALAV